VKLIQKIEVPKMIRRKLKTSKHQNKKPSKFTRRKANTLSPSLQNFAHKKFKTHKMTRRKIEDSQTSKC
jgi:hypothetical protein